MTVRMYAMPVMTEAGAYGYVFAYRRPNRGEK